MVPAPTSALGCLRLAEGPGGAPVPALLLEGDGLPNTLSVEESVGHCLWDFFFPKTRQILVLSSGSALRSHGEKEHDHPIVLNNIQHRSSEKDSFPVKAGEPLQALMGFFKRSGNPVYQS